VTTSALERLRSEVSAATTPEAKAETTLKLALCLAQLGKADEAKDLLSQVRESFSSGRVPRVSIRLLLTEGVISYYEDLSDSSDRLNRAIALAKAIGLADMCAEISVWISHLAYNFENYDILENSLRDIFSGFELLDDSLRARACLLAADGNHYLGKSELASSWYAFARIFSRRVRDHAVMVAIEYNRLGMGLSRIRVERALNFHADAATRRHWLIELESVRRLHVGFDVRALSELIDLCDAYTHELLNEFEKALSALRTIQEKSAAQRCGVSDALLELEIAWCESKLTGVGTSGLSFHSILDRIETLDANERLLALSFVGDANEFSAGSAELARYLQIRVDATAHYQSTISELTNALAVTSPHLHLVAGMAGLPSSGA
jgi:hypothetical protein